MEVLQSSLKTLSFSSSPDASTIFATALALCLLETRFADLRTEWELVGPILCACKSFTVCAACRESEKMAPQSVPEERDQRRCLGSRGREQCAVSAAVTCLFFRTLRLGGKMLPNARLTEKNALGAIFSRSSVVSW